MSKFTPGPWRVEESWGKGRDEPKESMRLCFHSILDSNDNFVASTWAEPNKPNAHLIAAAPEMFEALENALGVFNERECSCDGEYDDGRLVGHACYFHRIEQDLKSAIAKARGES